MADAEVRAATPADAPEITRVQLATWRSAYAELLPPEVLAGLDEAETTRQWTEALAGEPTTVLVATEGDWLVGFCVAGPAPEQEAAAADGSAPPDLSTVALVSTVLVEPRWGRRGHGGRLLATMARRLAESGSARGISWIPEADSVTQAFFEHAGWGPDGTVRTLDAGGRPVRELRLSGPLDLRLQHPE